MNILKKTDLKIKSINDSIKDNSERKTNVKNLVIQNISVHYKDIISNIG